MIDPTDRSTWAIRALAIWLIADFFYSLSAIATIAGLGTFGEVWPSDDLAKVDYFATITGGTLVGVNIITCILVARWIMRVNANAHTMSDAMTISPGWNVGYFFIPIMNLWKPFQGISETWQASSAPHDPGSIEIPILMRWWWGLWLATNILSNISFRLTLRSETADALTAACWVDVVAFLVDIPLAICLITLIQRLTEIQRSSKDYSEVFA